MTHKGLIILVVSLFLTGCSLPVNLAQENKTPEQPSTQVKQPDKQSNIDLSMAEPLAGQKDNPVMTPDDYSQAIASANETMRALIEALMFNDLKNATSMLQGLDEEGSAITLEELQQEVEALHPVQWKITKFQPAGTDQALVALSCTMADGTVRITDEFNMINLGEQWVVHYNSFARSFHVIAHHLIKNTESNANSQKV